MGKEEFRISRFDAETGKIAYDMERDHSFKARNGIEDGQACRRCTYREMCGGPCPATRIMGSSPHLFETERRLKCAMTKPIVDFFMESLVSGCEFRLPRTMYAFAD